MPVGAQLAGDDRCRLVQQDFFAAALNIETGLDSEHPGKLFHAILLDIDHTPSHQLDNDNESFYSSAGLSALSEQLYPGGVFGLWSNDPPDAGFSELLRSVFDSAEAVIVPFYNPIQDKESANTVYLAQKG